MKLIDNYVEVLDFSNTSTFKQIEKTGRICYKSDNRITDDSNVEFVQTVIDRKHNKLLEHGTVYLMYDINNVKSRPDNIKAKYSKNRYSQINVVGNKVYITTNLRVIIENDYNKDLRFEATEINENQPKRISVKIICSKRVSHELTKQRAFSIAQDGTRYSHYHRYKIDKELTFIKPHWYNESNDIFNIEKSNDFKEYLEFIENKYLSLQNKTYTVEDVKIILPDCLKTEIVMTGFLSDWEQLIKSRYIPSEQPEVIAILTLVKRNLRII
jgi:thymidylate synthase (FAD)